MTLIKTWFQADIFWQLLCTKATNIRTKLVNAFIDYYIWAGCTLFVSGHVLQAFGMSQDFGAFQFCAMLSAVGLFNLYGNAITMVSDIEGDRSVDYYFSLPTTAITVLASNVFYYTCIGFITGVFLFPLAKLILGTQLAFAQVSWLSVLFFMLLTNLLFATTTILIASLVPSMDKFDVVWVRFIFPLWFLGGFQFSWQAIYSKSPWLAYVILLNPITYATEGMRAAMLGQEGYLPFWICSTVLLVLLGVVGRVAYVAFKKRLDFV